jgi:hypothetical protein
VNELTTSLASSVVKAGVTSLTQQTSEQSAGELLRRLQGFYNRFAHGPPFVITGVKSVGKTVLFDHLTGNAFSEDWSLPDASIKPDYGKLKSDKIIGKPHGLAIPGETNSSARQSTLIQALDKKVSGFIHVVCGGLAPPRSPDARKHLEARHPEMEDFRKEWLEREAADFEIVCHDLTRYWERHRAPFWLLLVIAKIDLFTNDEVEHLTQHYGDESGLVGHRMLRLRDTIGHSNLLIDGCYSACVRENFHWNGKVRNSSLTETERRIYVTKLREKIISLSGS